MTPHYQDDTVTVFHGDCRTVLATLPENSVDAVVCDPPYELSSDGKASPSRVLAKVMFPQDANVPPVLTGECELGFLASKIADLCGGRDIPREPTHTTGLLFLAGRLSFLRLPSVNDETVCPDSRRPFDECPWCDGEACSHEACVIPFWQGGPWCEHDVMDRHSNVRPEPQESKPGHNAGGPSVLIAYGLDAADRLRRCALSGAYVDRPLLTGCD